MPNSYQHPDAEVLIPNVAKIIEPLADLVQRARESDDVDLVYVNLGCRDLSLSSQPYTARLSVG